MYSVGWSSFVTSCSCGAVPTVFKIVFLNFQCSDRKSLPSENQGFASETLLDCWIWTQSQGPILPFREFEVAQPYLHTHKHLDNTPHHTTPTSPMVATRSRSRSSSVVRSPKRSPVRKASKPVPSIAEEEETKPSPRRTRRKSPVAQPPAAPQENAPRTTRSRLAYCSWPLIDLRLRC